MLPYMIILRFFLREHMQTKNKQLTKAASFTDIHWGCKSNSDQHNQDCLNFINWFCDQVRQDPSIDHVIFMGDWFENRSALNISTMNYSYQGAKTLNELGLPIYFIIGNHDLYHRHTRDVHSVVNFHEFNNFIVIDEPVLIEQIADGSILSPYLFHDEYPELAKFLKYKTWWGHFEFKGFVVTGYNVLMPTGPDPKSFAGPDRIFSGHFHKRQLAENIVYIGNTFPTNFGDAGDSNRGMAVYNHEGNKLEFIDWPDAPLYVKTSLSSLMDESIILPTQSRVKCLVDLPISFEESTLIKSTYIADRNLREFSLEESSHLSETLSETTTDIQDMNMEMHSVDEMVIRMLTDIKSEKIDNMVLVEQYKLLG